MTQTPTQVCKISFCTWILNRLAQFREVLPINLARTVGHDVEFVVLDVGSRDGLGDYVHSVQDPRVRYVRAAWDLPRLHFARLYNAVHRLATGDVLVTLDADNAIGPEFCTEIARSVSGQCFVWATDGDWGGGTIGRVAFDRDAFWQLGGYDESLGPIGYQDVDLMERAKAAGLQMRYFGRPAVVGHAIRNTKADTASGLGMTAEEYHRVNLANRLASKANIAAGRLVANLNSQRGAGCD